MNSPTLKKPFHHFSTIDLFESKKVSVNAENTSYIQNGEIYEGQPDILWENTVFIDDIAQIWNRGRFYQSKKNISTVSEMSKNTMAHWDKTVITIVEKDYTAIKWDTYSEYADILPSIVVIPDNVTDATIVTGLFENGCDILSTSFDGLSHYDATKTVSQNYQAIDDDMSAVKYWMQQYGLVTCCYKYPDASKASGESPFIAKYEEGGLVENSSTGINEFAQDNMLLNGLLTTTNAGITSAVNAIDAIAGQNKWIIIILDSNALSNSDVDSLLDSIQDHIDAGNALYLQMTDAMKARMSLFNIDNASIPFRAYKNGEVDAKLSNTTLSDIKSRMAVPTTYGISGQVLTSAGGSNAPVWKTGELIHPATNVSGTAAVTTAGSRYAAKWTGTCDGVTSLYTGLMVSIKVPVAGDGTYGTVMNINGLGEHPVVRNVNTAISTNYAVGCIVNFIYDANQTASVYINNASTSITGCWKVADFDSINTYQLRHQNGDYKAYTACPANCICLQKDELTLLPTNTSGSTGTSKTLTTESFYPFGAIVLVSTAYSANENIYSHRIWQQYAYDLRISFNTGSTLTTNKDVYIVAVPQADGKAKLAANPISQTLPTTDDGKIYIYLGHSYSTTNIEMYPVHPVYWFKDGKIQEYTGAKPASELAGYGLEYDSTNKNLALSYTVTETLSDNGNTYIPTTYAVNDQLYVVANALNDLNDRVDGMTSNEVKQEFLRYMAANLLSYWNTMGINFYMME